MAATRSRKEYLKYERHLATVQPGLCAFCAIEAGSDQLIKETKHFKIIYNIFPYSLWDGQRVVEHLMVAPQTHTDTLSALNDKQKAEYVDILQEYESNGYNIYARAPVSKIKSIAHQHTHLIKTEGAARRFLLLLRKPYFRIVS
ncbi:MAG TPA: hypothetical protein VG992_04955 [Candidatus Saccharimonadales bacterium]|nr:hypothetical protein [Candidatus Saccharimonadales bacterium]